MQETAPHCVKYGTESPTVRPAQGIEGMLCCGLDGRYFLRVRDNTAPDGFIDYALRHSDLSIRIIDDDAAFYDFGSEKTPLPDHAPDTLGLKTVVES